MILRSPIPNAAESVLGCCLLQPELAAQLNLEWFDDMTLREIAGRMLSMFQLGLKIDVVTLCHSLADSTGKEFGEWARIISPLPDTTPSECNFPYYADILNEKLARRMKQDAAHYFAAAAEDGKLLSPEEIAGHFGKIRAVTEKPAAKVCGMQPLVAEAITELENAMNSRGQMRGVPTGFPDIDRITSGLRSGQLVILAARPGIGKTALAITVACHAAVREKVPTTICSLEMSAAELTQRMLAVDGRVGLTTMRDGQMSETDHKKLVGATVRVAAAPIQIMDRDVHSLPRMASEVKRLRKEHGTRLVIIDYLQLMRARERPMESRYNEVTQISNGLKRLAMEMGIPIFCLAQLNRDSDKAERAPRLTDLRDSGAIEQDADIVMLMHRRKGSSEDDAATETELHIAKHRNGPTMRINLVFVPYCTRFESAAKI